MFKRIAAHAAFNEQTGYGIHATNFFRELGKLFSVLKTPSEGLCDIHISLLDSVSAQHVRDRHPFPSILYNVWESTEQPKGFLDKLNLYDQMWVPSEWQCQCTIDQGVNPDFVKVVPEGVDPGIYKPIDSNFHRKGDIFTFLIVGKWEHRKASREMVAAWLETFKDIPNVKLQISADNPFPVDEYRTTEERLKGYGLESDKIEIVHFESKDDHLRRLQNAEVYLSCSRAEGWNLPLIEAMACGIPAVALDWSGSTEFAKDALLVKVKELKKPEHVYGMPDCPGLWAEPDMENFKEILLDVYHNYDVRKKKALEVSEHIRREFSWKRAAEKAMEQFKWIEDNAKRERNEVAEKIKNMKTDQIFCIGCWPSSEEKMATLVETIGQIKAKGFPVLVTSHYALPPTVIEMADYYIYDKRNELSGDWRATYSRNNNGVIETTKAKVPYHAVAVMHAIQNAIDFCVDKYKVMHYMEFDIEFDIKEYLSLWLKKPSEKKMLALTYEGRKDAIQSCLFSGELDWLSFHFPVVNSWDEYLSRYGEKNYVLEHWLMKDFERTDRVKELEIVDYPITNRFDQVDREAWPDDVFSCNFLNGAVLHINGLSRREYDVTFSNPEDGDVFNLQHKVGTWSSPNPKYYRDWHIKAKLNGELKFEHKLDLKDKRVILALGSKALGDTVAWIPYFEEFRKTHNCHVIVSSWFNGIFDYPEFEWTKPGTVHDNIYALYEVGCYDGQIHKNKRDWRTIRMQEIATDILGLEYREIKPQMKAGLAFHYDKPHVTFSEHSTMQAKLWNRPGAWQQVIDYLNDVGLIPVSISKEPTTLKNVKARNNKTIEETIQTMRGAEFHVGLGAGPSWLAWACNIPVVMISGFSEPWCEYENLWRIMPPVGVCKGCFNDPTLQFDRGWDWCPTKKNYECTREITAEHVIERIEDLITRP